MSLERNKAIVRKYVEAYNKQDLQAVDELLAPDYFDHTHQVGPDGTKQLIAMGFKAFPDWHESVQDIIAEGDKVWVLLQYSGTHVGDWRGLPPTGNRINTMAVDIYRVVDGKLSEYWNVTDSMPLLKQIGVIEYTERGKSLFP